MSAGSDFSSAGGVGGIGGGATATGTAGGVIGKNTGDSRPSVASSRPSVTPSRLTGDGGAELTPVAATAAWRSFANSDSSVCWSLAKPASIATTGDGAGFSAALGSDCWIDASVWRIASSSSRGSSAAASSARPASEVSNPIALMVVLPPRPSRVSVRSTTRPPLRLVGQRAADLSAREHPVRPLKFHRAGWPFSQSHQNLRFIHTRCGHPYSPERGGWLARRALAPRSA